MNKTSSRSLMSDLLIGAVAGVVASSSIAPVNQWLSKRVSRKQKRREKWLRKGSAHDVAGPLLVERAIGKDLSEKGEKRAEIGFFLFYGVLWGVIHSLTRRTFTSMTRWGGTAFALPFFLACDGMMAPLLRLTPGIQRLPWQINAKELSNHLAWSATAEAVHRLAEQKSLNRWMRV